MPSSFAQAQQKLEALVRQTVKHNTPNSQGVSQRQTQVSARKQMERTGKFTKEHLDERFKELNPIELLPGTEYLLQVFDTLSSTRTMLALPTTILPAAITLMEIAAYSRAFDCDLEPWEIEAIRAMDSGFLEESYIIRSKQK